MDSPLIAQPFEPRYWLVDILRRAPNSLVPLANWIIRKECERLERIIEANQLRASVLRRMIETECAPLNEGLTGDECRELHKRSLGIV